MKQLIPKQLVFFVISTNKWITSVSAILPPVHKILRAIETSNVTILQQRTDIPIVSSDSQIDEMCLPLSSLQDEL